MVMVAVVARHLLQMVPSVEHVLQDLSGGALLVGRRGEARDSDSFAKRLHEEQEGDGERHEARAQVARVHIPDDLAFVEHIAVGGGVPLGRVPAIKQENGLVRERGVVDRL